MAIPTFPSPPPAPNRSTDTQEQFDAKAETWANYLSDDFGPDVTEFGADLIAEATSFYTSASTTALMLSGGTKNAVIEARQAFKPGQTVVFADVADPLGKRMSGPIQSYNVNTGALVFSATAITGSGASSAWIASVAGEKGDKGDKGDDGDKGDKGDKGDTPIIVVAGTGSNTVSTGTKTFTVPAGSGFAVGMYVVAAANSTNAVYGTVASYSGTSLTVNIAAGGTIGAGTFTNWTISLSGPRGDMGPTAGWEQIGSDVSMVGATVATFDPFPTNYSDILFEIDGISHSSGTAQAVVIEGKSGSSTWTQITSASNQAAATIFSRSVFLVNTKSIQPLAISPNGNVQNLGAKTAGIRVRWDAGAVGDAGAVRLYGR